MHDVILSTFRRVPTSRFVYSSLGFYAPLCGGELSGAWFARALTILGIEETAVRQTLYRMEREGALSARRDGRWKLYSPTGTTRSIIEAGTAKMLRESPGPWDRSWTVVRFRLEGGDRPARERLRDLLGVEGFAALGPGFYLHPRDRWERLRQALEGLDLEGGVHVFRGPRLSIEPDDKQLARQLWDVDGIAERYRQFTTTFQAFSARRSSFKPDVAAALRFAAVFRFLEVAWDDPELPPELLPASWPGGRARHLIRALYQMLTPPALEFGRAVSRQIGGAGGPRGGLRSP